MNKDLEAVCAALDTIGREVITAWSGDASTTYAEAVGWSAPALSKVDLSRLATDLAADIRSTQAESLAPSIQKFVADLPRRLLQLQANSVPHFATSNAGQAIPAYIHTLQVIRAIVLPALGWVVIPDPNALPPGLVRRARAAKSELDRIAPDLENLAAKVDDIQNAHRLADSLPVVLQDLTEAHEKLKRVSSESEDFEKQLKSAAVQCYTYLGLIEGKSEEAAKLVAQCESAYQITTTKGLAGAFDQRASRLAWSMWTWVIGLIVALCLGSYIGSHRLEALSAALQSSSPNWGAIIIQAVLSLLSVGAPLWFAWLATRQIGQRFRLAEDYAFKASVAKAYEGYRREAARIDPDFEHRLFGSALSRLDEAPLRLVEAGSPGSPWQEAANNEAVKRAMDAMPDVREKFVASLREIVDLAARAANRGKSTESGGVPPTAS